MARSYAVFNELPIREIKPEGWLRKYLETQRDGLTGHLEAAGYPFNGEGWMSSGEGKHGEAWWPFEQTGYWIDGIVRCGHLLGDDFLLGKAVPHIDYVLEHADDDGYLGPEFMKAPKYFFRWSHAVFFRAMMAHFSATGNNEIPKAIAKHYTSGTAPHDTLRDVCNIEQMLWAYEQTGQENLLEQAIESYDAFNRNDPDNDTSMKKLLSDERADEHGVTYNEMSKLGAILYMYTGKKKYLEASVNAYKKIDRDQMLIDGICSSTERLRGKDPLDSHETCDIADYTWSVGYMLQATGSADYADKIEKACFNAAPGAVTPEFSALQYFSCPNQVIADKTSNHNLFHRGFPWMSYRPNPGTECCPGEVNRIMPNYAARMWLSDGSGGLVAALYGPSRITTQVGRIDKQEITITEETTYPFSETIGFEFSTAKPVTFPLTLRIPGWCKSPSIYFNGKKLDRKLKPGTFVTVKREFSDGDRLELILPMEIKVSEWPRGGIGIERGPLVYALKIEEDWQIDKEEKLSTEEFPAYNLYAASPWNYALVIDKDPDAGIEINTKPMTAHPWSINAAPIELKMRARRVKDWSLEFKTVIDSEVPNDTHTGFVVRQFTGKYTFTPQLPDPAELPDRLADKTETVTLVPYGCTCLRLAVFPWAGKG